MKDRIRVCLILEGSYPYITGGVSSWVHQLIQGIPEVDFVIYSISPKGNQELHYTFPDNVVEHFDLVISEKAKEKRKRVTGKREILKEILEMHRQFENETVPEMERLLKLMPRGYYLYRDSVRSDEGWSLITERNQKMNPVYPFSDYFWAWKSTHDMMFTILGTDPPKADLYHAISTGYAGLAGIVATIRTGKPYMLTEHGLYHKEREIEIRRTKMIRGYQRDMWIKVYNMLSKLTYRYAEPIISLFEYNRRMQVELGAKEEKTLVIPNGIDTERYLSVKREKREGFHVGLVGRVVPIKDIKTFIATAKIVSDVIPEAQFYCIGPTDEDPGYYDDCKLLVKSFHLEEKFRFTGKQDVRKYYAFLDVLMLTSIREAQPLVILEGFCSGVPAVATRVGNVPELLDYDEHFLAPSKDPEKLAEGVIYIYRNRDKMDAIIERNREKVVRFYDRNKVYRRYYRLYQSLSGGSKWQE